MEKRRHRPFTLFLCLILCAFIILGPIYFIEYSHVKNHKSPKDMETNWKGVITLWDYPRLDSSNGTRFGWINRIIKDFERAHPGVYIELKPMDWSTGPMELETAIQTKSYPDMAPVGSDYSIIGQNVLEPLDEYLSPEILSNYRTHAIEAVRYNRQIWGIPWMMTTYTMFLNLELFHEKGIRPPEKGNWTYEEFVETMKALTYDRDGDGKNDVYGFHSFIDLNDYNCWGILLADGAEFFNEEKDYKFNDKRAISGLKKLADLKLVHKVTPESLGKNSENEAWDLFSNQKKVAVYPTGTWAINVLNNLRYEGKGFEFGVANYPIGEKGVPVPMAQSVAAYGIFKQQDKEKLKMCVKFLQFISQEKYQKELYRLGVFPVNKNVGEIYKNDSMMGLIENSIAYTKGIPDHPQWLTIDGLIQSQIRQVLLELKTPEEALRDAEMKINILLRAQRKVNGEKFP